jgi:hypothetical protein
MKPRHWINLIGVGLTAGLLTFLAFRWALATYAEPTCRRYAESKSMIYIGFIPPDPSASTGTSRMSRDGNCQLRASNGDVKTESLVGASGSSFGAPLLVSFALNWELMFLASFFGVAFILAILIRVFTGKPAS